MTMLLAPIFLAIGLYALSCAAFGIRAMRWLITNRHALSSSKD